MIIVGYLIAALASIFIANAIPHLTRGSAGYLHRVPWRVPASAAENVLWACINLVIGIWIGYWASTYGLFLPLALTVGVIVGGGFRRSDRHPLREQPRRARPAAELTR